MAEKKYNDDESKTVKYSLVPDSAVVVEEQGAAKYSLVPDSAVVVEEQGPAAVAELASKQQVYGAALAGGITGLLICGPIGAILLGWVGVRLAKKNPGDVGDFCRKVGDFMHRIGGAIKKEWKEARSKHSGEAEQSAHEVC